MAILQLSKITHRKGYHENLPQLAGAEFGWALDERRLYIGNGKIEDGAPTIGNTEILTSNTDLLAMSGTYTYKGEQAGYVVNTNDPDIIRSLQSKFDETVSVLDFGAVGDGHTDDTDAIKRAMNELFCINENTKARRALYFPAGIYVIKDRIHIPPYAKLYGDGKESTIIRFLQSESTPEVDKFVIGFADSEYKTGINMGQNNATMPSNIDVSAMSFKSEINNSIIDFNHVTDSSFTQVGFSSNMTVISGALGEDFDPLNDTVSISIKNSNNIVFEQCSTSGTNIGMIIQDNSRHITFSTGKMFLHTTGVILGLAPIMGGPTGVTITRTIFDDIGYNGILIGQGVRLNTSAFNVFYNVGNDFSSIPRSSIIEMLGADNLSIGDLFERPDDNEYPRINLNGHRSIGFDGARAMLLGQYERTSAMIVDMPASTIIPTDILSLMPRPGSLQMAFKFDYTIKMDDYVRTGTLSSVSTNEANYSDDFTESDVNTNIKLDVFSAGVGGESLIRFSNIGLYPATMTFSVVRLD